MITQSVGQRWGKFTIFYGLERKFTFRKMMDFLLTVMVGRGLSKSESAIGGV